MNPWNARGLEFLGQVMLGDGITCLIAPRQHMRMWIDAFPWRPWRRLVGWYADHPGATIATGLIESAIAVALILRANRDQ